MRRLDRGDGGALQNHTVKKPRGQRRGAQRADRGRARRLARERDVFGVAAKARDIVAHPLQSLDLIEQAVVAGGAVFRFRHQLFVGQITEHAETVGKVDIHRALPRQVFPAVVAVPGLPGLQRAAVDIDVHRQPLRRAGGLEDVDVQRVLADRGAEVVLQRDLVIVIADDLGERVIDRQVGRLHAHGRKVVAQAHAVPALHILRLAPAQLVHGRCGIGDTGIDLDRAVGGQHALHLSVAERDDLCPARAFPLDRRDRLHGRPCQKQDERKERDPSDPAQKAQAASRRAAAQKDKQRRRGDREQKAQKRILIQFQYRKHQQKHNARAEIKAHASPFQVRFPSSPSRNLFPLETTLIIAESPPSCQLPPVIPASGG